MSTSDKLTYLNTTKTKIKDAINLGNANITTETFRQYENKIKQAIVNTMLDKWGIWNNFDKVTGTNESLTLSNTEYAPMQVNLKGNTQQDSTTGYQLIDFSFRQGAVTGADLTLRICSLGDYQLGVGTYTFSTDLNLTNYDYYIVTTTNTYPTSTIKYNSGWQSTNPFTFSIIFANVGYVWLNIAKKNHNDTISTTDVSNNKFMIETGSTPHNWEPYTNGASPNPSYPQEIHNVSGDNTIEICGKNLFKEWHSGYMNTTTHQPTTGSRNITDYIQVRPSTKYTFWREDTGFASYAYEYDANYNYLEAHTITSDYTTISFTTKANTKYVILYQYIDYAPTNKAQLEVGESHTTFEPYTGNSQLISLGVENLFDKDNVNWYRNNNTSWSNTTDTNTTRIRTSSFKLKGGKTYTISGIPSGINFMGAGEFAEYEGTNIGSATVSGNTFTLSANANYVFLLFGGSNFDSSTNTLMANANIQIEKGSKANSFNPYGTTPIELNKISTYQDKILCGTGKNLLDLSQVEIGVAWNNSSNSARAVCYVKVEPNTQYTISYNNISTFDGVYNFEKTNKTDSVATSSVSEITGTKTITTTATSNYLGLQFNKSSISSSDFIGLEIQIEEGSETSYEPYGFKDKWYLHKEIGKFIYNNEGSVTSSATDYYNINGLTNQGWDLTLNTKNYLSNKYLPSTIESTDTNFRVATANMNNAFGLHSNGTTIRFKDTRGLSTSDFKTSLIGTIFYFALATPTDTEITDTTLISQLNNLAQVNSYEGQTNISQENNDKPFIITATALEGF